MNKVNMNEDSDLQLIIIKTLHNLGLPSNINGYQYIKEAINLIYYNPILSGSITKNIYPILASKHGTTKSCIERSIRHAILVSWNRGSWILIDDIFGFSIDDNKSKPTNSEFIVTVAEKILLDKDKLLF